MLAIRAIGGWGIRAMDSVSWSRPIHSTVPAALEAP